MGYVHKPIPPDILAKMPPDVRRRAIEGERAFLRGVQRRQGGLMNFGGTVLIAVACLAVMLAMGGAQINWPW